MTSFTVAIIAIIAVFVLIEVAPHIIAYWLHRGARKHRLDDKIKRRTPVGNLAYAAMWVILVSWLGLVGYLVVAQLAKRFDVDSVGGLCVMVFVSIMLIRELYRAHRSRRSP